MRFLRAFALAPLAALVVYWAWSLAAGLAAGRPDVMHAPLRELAVLLVFGAPVAYAAALAAFAVGFRLLRMQGAAGALAVTMAGAAAGMGTAIFLRPHLGADLFRVVLTPLQGAVMGGVSGLCFQRLWTRWRRPAE